MVESDRQLILVDGRSGSGKTQWAAQAARASGFVVISLDDVYPGWDGLDAGHWRVYRDAIVPWSRGEVGTLLRWDWQQMTYVGEISIPAWANLIVEGCGALSSLTSPYATRRYWLEADTSVRRQRALERDGEMFSPHWQRWALQEERFYSLHRSRELADHIIST